MAWFEKKQTTYADVVRAYGKALSEPSRNATATHQASKLPFEIGLIKEAICRVAVDGRGNVPREQLKVAFVQLATFVDDYDERALPEPPATDATAQEQAAFAQQVLDVMGGAPDKQAAVAQRMQQLDHEFEARCKFIDLAEAAE
jgi:hypothetical protein